jgi:hypothetical protein
MSKTDNDVGTGLVGAPACGDVMKFIISDGVSEGNDLGRGGPSSEYRDCKRAVLAASEA